MEIKVIRPLQLADTLRDYLLWADEHENAVIKPNSVVTVRLPEGAQSLRATIDWCSSPDFVIDDIRGHKRVVKNAFASRVLSALTLPLY